MIFIDPSTLDESTLDCYPFKNSPSLTDDMITSFQQRNGIILPADLIRLLSIQNGGWLHEDAVDEDSPFSLMTSLHSLVDESQESIKSCAIISLKRGFQEMGVYDDPNEDNFLIAGCRPISDLGDLDRVFVIHADAHYFFLLDYRDSETCKGIGYLDIEGGDGLIHIMANSLDEVFDV